MKNILITVLMHLSAFSFVQAQECKETHSEIVQDVLYKVNKNQPSHLKGAVIIVRLADGRESKVSADKFMVVPRKQQTVAGQNKLVMSKLRCDKDQKKNIVYVGAKKELTDLETRVSGNSARVESSKTLTPSLNYMRRKVLNSDLNLGIGIDKNSQIGGTIGLDF